jgi:hypothetical protein
MSSPEFPSQLSKVQERRLNIAAEIGDKAASAIAATLEKYVGHTITAEQRELIASGERNDAAHQYILESIAGLHNDRMNDRPGITAIIRGKARPFIENVLRIRGALGSDEAPIFEEMPESQSGLVQMRLEKGLYEEKKFEYPMMFCTSGIRGMLAGREGFIHAKNRFDIGLHDLVQVTSDAGDFWQNPQLGYDEATHQITNYLD